MSIEVIQLVLVIPAAGMGMWLGIAMVDQLWTAWEEGASRRLEAAGRAENGSRQ